MKHKVKKLIFVRKITENISIQRQLRSFEGDKVKLDPISLGN
jgi:hypothetical protein